MFPAEVTKSVAVYHLPTAGGQKQAYLGSPSATVSGVFLPMDTRQHALEGGDLANPLELYVDPGTDIRIGDKLVIDSATYCVKRVFSASFGGIAHKRCSVSTQRRLRA